MKNTVFLFLLLSLASKSQIDKKSEVLYERAFYSSPILPELKKQFRNNKKSLYCLYTEYILGSKPIIKKANTYIETGANGSKRYTTNYHFYRGQKLDDFEKAFCLKNKIEWIALSRFRDYYGDAKLKDYEYFKSDY